MLTSKYDIASLRLTDEYLTDPLLLALAWKKAHSYIRSASWYADNFELDKSSLFLDKNCQQWSNELTDSKITLSPLLLVPAPKSAEWHFVSTDNPDDYCVEWQPKDGTALSLRPLAHIGIKEQTVFTLLMMCLANKVETLQGDPSSEFAKVQDKKIVSYGNRLYCIYNDEGQAEHNYGATTLYSKFFIDYRRFLQRPYYFAQQLKSEILPDEEIYLVELDLAKFYDQIDRKKLIERINKLQENSNFANNPVVKYLLDKFDKWRWKKGTRKAYTVCHTKEYSKPPRGIPQGLVAGGFLSNVYLLDFDEAMCEQFGQDISKPTQSWLKENSPQIQGLEFPCFKLIDYCRYVDDMRLVIVGPKPSIEAPIALLKETLHCYITTLFESVGLEIPLNQDKTKITVYHGKQQGISKQLNDIQIKASGPQSYEESFEQLSQLETLLALSAVQVPEQTRDGCRINALANIERSSFDVREDTLRRFAANKIASTLSDIRHFTARETDDNGNALAGDWDYLQERMARRLIACWSKDPALTLLLKKGLELFPSPRLLEPVLEQLGYIINQPAKDEQKALITKQQAIMHYLLAEVFRHSATVIHRKDPQAIPAHADVKAYFSVLQELAAKVINEPSTPSLLINQARFLLLVRMDTLLEKDSGDAEHDTIFKLAKGFRNITLTEKTKLAACILLADQLVADNAPLIIAANQCINNLNTDKPEKISITSSLLALNKNKTASLLRSVAAQNTVLVEQLVRYGQQLKLEWTKDSEVSKIIKALYLEITPSKKALANLKQQQSIIQLITRPDNPFANEIMAIKLMQALLTVGHSPPREINKLIDLSKTYVQFDGYHNPPSYEDIDKPLNITDIGYHQSVQPLAQALLPNSSATAEQLQLRRVAFVTRAALAGNKDITGFGHSYTPKAGYRGLKSTQLKRQIGLFTTPESLAGEGAQTTGWLTTLITKLLRWPGIRVNEQGHHWPIELDFESVERLLKERLAILKQNYCQLSGMPALSELITPNWSADKQTLSVAMVQTKLPKASDLATDIYLNASQYRTKHRRHVARAAELVLKHIAAQSTEKPALGQSEQHIDLIVFPELAVHPDDLNILIQLSRKTHAIIFAGLGFVQQPHISGPNNSAIWIVPRKHNGNGNEICRFQGKQHMTAGEIKLETQPWRPYQLMLELRHPAYKEQKGFMLTGAICYDATDIKLSADLADKSNALLISAMNRDVNTFDSMVEALHYHMYQHVVLVNTGEYGGSYAMAPYQERHDRLIAHTTGKNQVTINTFAMNMFDFRRDGIGRGMVSNIKVKTPPAGVI